MSFDAGPFLATAVLCEKVLQEKDGVLSLIRIVDRVIASVPSAPSLGQSRTVSVSLVAALAFKSGSARGSHTISIRPEAPSGLKKADLSVPVLFEGQDRGVNINLSLTYQTDEEGLHWFDVLLDGQLVTRMPLRIVYQWLSVGGTTSPEPPQE